MNTEAQSVYHDDNQNQHIDSEPINSNTSGSDDNSANEESQTVAFHYPSDLSRFVEPFLGAVPRRYRQEALDMFTEATKAIHSSLDRYDKPAILRWVKQLILLNRSYCDKGDADFEAYSAMLLLTSDYKEAGLEIVRWAVTEHAEAIRKREAGYRYTPGGF